MTYANQTLNVHQAEARMDRFGLKIAARLNESANALPHDISERLRVARLQAVANCQKQTQLQTASHVSMSGGAATLGGGDGLNIWTRITSLVPLLALAVGLIAINVLQNDERARELADVELQLLTDDLPPAAHTDAGFVQFLKFGSPGQ